MSEYSEIFKITSTDNPFELHVEISSATLIAFNINFTDIDHYHETISDVCAVAPHMMELDADLMEAYDDAFRTQPKPENRVAVGKFLHKYRGKIDRNLIETFR